MSATQQLREDHNVIEKVLRAMEVTVSLLKNGNDVPVVVLKDTVDFITNFTDRCHHSKEEDGLFPALNERGLPKDRGPIAVMLMEHEQARMIAKELSDAVEKYSNGDSKAKDMMIRSAEMYIAHVGQHLWKENNILFNLADSVLSDNASSINEKLRKIDEEKIGKEHDRYVKLADTLTSSVESI